MELQDILLPQVDEEDEEVTKVRGRLCSMTSLVDFYQSLSIVKSPRKSSPKKQRMSNGSISRQPISIILEDVESFPASVLQDFVVTCSHYLDRLPLVLVLGIATSVTAVHRLLPTCTSSLLCMEKFQAPPSTHYLTFIIDRILMTSSFPFKLGPKVFQLLLDMFLCHHFSVINFVAAFQYCMLEHYTTNRLAALCCLPDRLDSEVDLLSPEDIRLLQQLPSVMRHIETLPPKEMTSIFKSEDNFRKLVKRLLQDNVPAQERSMATMRLLNSLTSHLPGKPLGKQLRELYAVCLEEDIQDTEGFTRAFELLGLTAKDELTKLIEGCKCHLAATDPVQKQITKDLDQYLYRLGNLEEEQMEDNSENTHQDQDLKLQKTDLRSLQKKLQELGKKKKVSPYEKVRHELLEYIKKIVSVHLLKKERVALYEILYYDDLANVKQHLNAAPRSAIHQALSKPAYYLQCDCCVTEDGGISPTMPDVCIIYKLHLECGQLINLYDWLQAFASIVTSEDQENNKKDSKPDRIIQARFIQAVSELQLLGFIKPTKRKTDHVARLTWGGC